MFFGSNRNTGYHSCLRPRNGRSKLRAPLIPWLISMVLVSIYHSWMSTVSPLHLGYNTNLEINLPGIRAFDYRSACDGKANDSKRTWRQIDDTLLKDYPSRRISGGIFLYPRQASLLATLVGIIVDGLTHRRASVCETGFGSGHSLALFAHVSSLRIVSFDKFDRQYQIPMWNMLNRTFAQHDLDYVAGDSCETVPTVLSGHPFENTSIATPIPIHCDILHGSSLCPTDNIDLVEYAPCGALLTSTAMATLDDPAVYFGPHAQWRKLRRRRCITRPICFEEAALQLNRNFFFAEQGSAYKSRFCIAMTTGKCSKIKTSCDTDLYRVVSQLNLDQFCPQYQVSTPK